MVGKKILKKTTQILLDELVNHGASSASILLYQDDKLIQHQTTCDKWQDFYAGIPEVVHECHIKKQGILLANQKVSNFTLVWDLLIPDNDYSLYLNEERERFNHCHGISICKTLPDNQMMGIVLTGRRHETDFAYRVIKNKHKVSVAMQTHYSVIKQKK